MVSATTHSHNRLHNALFAASHRVFKLHLFIVIDLFSPAMAAYIKVSDAGFVAFLDTLM
jgi:hypothetical protein